MNWRRMRPAGLGLVAMALSAAALMGCSSIVGQGTNGTNALSQAEILNVSDYTADRALSEAKAHFRNNDFGYSAQLYKRAVELSPKTAEAYVGLGASYDRLGRFDLADRVYATLYALSGGTAQYYNNVGYSYMLRGNFSAALSSLRKAKALAPDSLVVANNLKILSSATRA